MKIKYEKGKPSHKGYYLVRMAEKYRSKKEKDRFPEAMYWNGEEWQDYSDDDAFEVPGDYKPLTFDAKFFDEFVEVEL